ncbi:RagB/SusD family nutrient uptake outer membrane protein [Pedobacter psychroterrae]|uniref:RagB/SusD family nutrient uptake outer membrane protein n=1 Tax=Pedobacter psychroterrae TaxID=2530453 RepID=A0A4V2MKP9_9SPHI|nr:RagB/SusD family nutrient uptake outer membrane protein [Pedobacter psychroterrae]TCC98906.1 RagB/SusD family nutrient uptake outer membrane protein [Pedobacter psychroterrae]
MNNLKKGLLVFIGAVSIASCEVVEPENLTFVNDKEIYSNITQIRNVLNNVYSGLPNGFSDIGTSWLAAASDEAEEVNNVETIQNFNTGNITPYSNPDDVWNKTYASIRNAKIFIQSTDTITWKIWQYSNPTEYTRRVELIKQYKAEAKFLTAFFYFELVKRYGGVPIVDEVIDKNTDWISRFPRRSFSDCVDFIVYNCDSAAAGLPATYDTGNYGRATKGAAMALKARILLYAASDLYNQSSNADPLLGYVGGDRTARWVKAAEANRAVITFTPVYAFQAKYETLSVLAATKSTEVIFERRYAASNTFEKQNTAVGFPMGATGTCPSGNLVDAFEHLDDGNFDWSKPAHAANPYNRRDPRLAKIVAFNGAPFGKVPAPVELFAGGINGKPRDRASKTGYYLRKYMNETLDLQLGEVAPKQWMFIRLAEIHLNYAEAMNEAYGPEGTGPGTLTVSARTALNSVRTRAAVALKAISAGADQQSMNALIRNERRVELAFEGHRFWDVRRWMIAGQAIGGTLRGVNVVKNADGTFSYTPTVVENRVWNDKLYYYPIPQSEISKSNGVIVQNRGW